MKRVGRVLLAGLLLLPLLVAILLWVRGLSRGDYITANLLRTRNETWYNDTYALRFASGYVHVSVSSWELPRSANKQREQLSRPVLWGWSRQQMQIEGHRVGWLPRRLGVSSDSSAGVNPYRYNLIFPHWILCAVFALPLVWMTRRAVRRWRRRRRGCCAQCGYDLRESPERCPECETPAAKATARAPARDAAHSPA